MVTSTVFDRALSRTGDAQNRPFERYTRNRVARILHRMPATTARPHLDLDTLMRDMALVGAAGLVAWAAASMIGAVSGYLVVAPGSAIRFVLAALILVFARNIYRTVREWRWRKVPADQRMGFSGTVVLPEAEDEALTAPTTATGSPRP
jgi:hypothetical protein